MTQPEKAENQKKRQKRVAVKPSIYMQSKRQSQVPGFLFPKPCSQIAQEHFCAPVSPRAAKAPRVPFLFSLTEPAPNHAGIRKWKKRPPPPGQAVCVSVLCRLDRSRRVRSR